MQACAEPPLTRRGPSVLLTGARPALRPTPGSRRVCTPQQVHPHFTGGTSQRRESESRPAGMTGEEPGHYVHTCCLRWPVAGARGRGRPLAPGGSSSGITAVSSYKQKVSYPISPSSPVSSWGNVERKHSWGGPGGWGHAPGAPRAWSGLKEILSTAQSYLES